MSIRTRIVQAGLLSALVVAAGACAQGGRPIQGDPFSASGDGPQTITIHVRNLNFSDATLWAVSRSGRQRLGVVTGKGDAVFRTSWTFPQPLQIEIDLLAGERCITEPLDVDPGDDLDLQIEMELYRQPGCR